jgi:hypothetical protein
MVDKPEQPSFYEPQGDNTAASPLNNAVENTAAAAEENGVTDKPKRGRPAKQAADAAVNLTPGLTADAQPQENESLEDAIKRIAALRDKTRQEWGQFLQKLALPVRPGYHRHWFNDVAGRIEEAKASGWAHVKNPRDGTPHKRAVGTGRDNNVLYAYAMEIPDVFWQQEMDARHAIAKEKIEGIKKKPVRAEPGQAQASDQGKFYSPSEEMISVHKG